MAEGTRMQQRRATEAVWTTSAYVLAPGELGVTTDTGIIKIGNGTSPWSELDFAFDSQFLPVLGKAADSELLDGIGSESFVKVADTSVTATNDSYVKRTADGGVKGTAATENDELTTLVQLTESRYHLIARAGTASITLQLTDAFSQVNIQNDTRDSVLTVTIPTNATVAFPIGAWVDISAIGIGTVVVSAAGGATFAGDGRVYGNFGSVRITKIDTNLWILSRRSDPPDAYARCFMYQSANTPGLSSGWRDLSLNAETIDTHGGHKTGSVSGDDTDSNPANRTNRYNCMPGQAGTYQLNGLFFFSGSGTDVQCRITKNGAVVNGSYGQNHNNSASSYVLTGEKLFVLAEGDYVSLQGFMNAAGWTSGGGTNANSSTLSVVRVS
jgi:hypothetical protein